ncbi:MAG: hypothetical protein R3A44_17405 [Caldilineaceae bacterium]
MWIATTPASAQVHKEHEVALAQRGATILPIPTNAQNQLDLSCLLHIPPKQHNIRSLMIEGGAHFDQPVGRQSGQLCRGDHRAGLRGRLPRAVAATGTHRI